MSMSNVNVRNTYGQHRVTRVRIGGAAAAEEMLDCVICSREQCSFHMCLESGDGR